VVCEESMSNGMQREGNEQLLCRGKVQAVTQGKVGVGCSAVEKSVVAHPSRILARPLSLITRSRFPSSYDPRWMYS
jgi:hypothetical protein